MPPHCESASCPRRDDHYVGDRGCEDAPLVVRVADDLRLLGADSGEFAARTALLMSLGQGWNVEQTIARDEPDELRIVTPDGSAFSVKADRLYLEWQPSAPTLLRSYDEFEKQFAPRPSMTVDKLGGRYSIQRVPWPWWRRPRWAWALGWRLRAWWQER